MFFSRSFSCLPLSLTLKQQRIMQLFPEKIRQLWSNWEVRVLIQLSLLLQVILIIFGSRRKFTRRSWIRILVWLTYLSADWIATVALGNLAGSQGDSEDNASAQTTLLQAFWAPFLLLHLGGPDTITAYSLEDNELWLRHFLGLVVQVGGALYVFVISWSNTVLTFLTIAMFISGIIKYGERTFALKSSSSQNFKESLPSIPDPCPDYIKFVDQDTRGKRLEGSAQVIIVPQEGINPEDHCFVQAYFLFRRLEYHFAEVVLGNNDRMHAYSIIGDKSTEDAFKMVAVELGFMYDVLYTKATIIYSRLGMFLRCISFVCSVSVLILFSIIIDVHAYPIIHIYITYLLLVGAVLLEIYSFIILIYSDWTKLWLIKLKKAPHNMISKTLVDHFWKFISFPHSVSSHRTRWSRSMGQYNLISSCLKKVQPTWIGVVQKLPWIGELIEKYRNLTREDVDIDNLQDTIFRYLKEQGHTVNVDNPSYGLRDLVLAQRGDFALKKRYHFGGEFHWCTIGIEFVDSLVIWHLATDICYYGDLDDIHGGDVTNLNPKCKISKCLSNYMFYLLVLCPSVLPKGIGEIRYTGTYDELMSFFKEKGDDISNESKACKALLQKYPQQRKSKLQGDFELSLIGETQSLLKYGCLLSSQLQEKAIHHHQRKWEIISDVWVEMLAYAAHSCGWKEHCQRLKEGGELLTHVCLLMAHFGLSKQYVQDTLVQLTPEVMAAEILKEEEKMKLPFRRW